MGGILSLINLFAPLGVQLVTMILHKDGTMTAVAYLDEADANFAANQKQISDWFAAHPKTSAT